MGRVKPVFSDTKALLTVPGQLPDVRGCVSLSQNVHFETIPVFQPGLGSPEFKYSDPPYTLTQFTPICRTSQAGERHHWPELCVSVCGSVYIRLCPPEIP